MMLTCYFECSIFLQYYHAIRGNLKVLACHFHLLQLMSANDVGTIKAAILLPAL